MAEVEKKKRLSKRDWFVLGTAVAVLIGFAGFELYSAYVSVKENKERIVRPKRVSPAQVSPETVAKAIGKKEEKPPAEGKVPTPTAEKVEKKSPPKKESGQQPKQEEKKKWKLPEPSGSLKVVAGKEKRKPFTFGLPAPTGESRLFKMENLKQERRHRTAERMKVITPRLVVVSRQERKAPSAVKKPVSSPAVNYETVVAAGMFVPAVLSQGIKAPIGYKVPVRFKLIGSAVGVGNYSFPLDSCVVLGAGKGIQTGSSARIEVELVKLSCVWPDGKLHTVPVNGYAVDSADGRLYLSANLEEHTPEIVQKSFIAGALLGAAEAAQKAQEISKTTAVNQTTSITTQEIKNPTAYTFWGGVAGALSQTQKLIEQSVAELTKLKTADRAPGGKVYLVFTQDLRVPKEWLKPKANNHYDFAGYER